MVDERRAVEDFSEQDIKDYNEFCGSAYPERNSNGKKKTLIAKIIVKWQKKQVKNTEIKVKQEIAESIQDSMDWENLKNEEEIPPVPVSEKSGEEVMEMKKKSYEELQIATQEIKDELFLSQEQDEKSFSFLPKFEDSVESMARDIDFRTVTAEDRKILIEIFGDEAVDKAENLQIYSNL